MTFESLDVVVVPFPFTDRRTSKRRPALIVSSSSFHRAHDQFVLAMITSTANDWSSDVAIREWREAGLNVPCKVRFKLFTLDGALIVRKAGRLSKKDGEEVVTALGQVLAGN